MKLLKRHWPTLLGAALGALGGYLYWYFVGCADGTCPITSSPLNSTLWGAVMGGLLLSMFEPKPPPERVKKRAPGRFRTPVFAADGRYRPVTRM